MRAIASRLVGWLGLLVVAGALAPVTQSAAAGSLTLNLTLGKQGNVLMSPGGPNKAGRTWGYWGKFTGTRTGSYRGTCVWLADKTWKAHNPKQDYRLACSIIFAFAPVKPVPPSSKFGDAVVVEGLVRRPRVGDDPNLFQYPSFRELAVTGGTGKYRGQRGFVNATAPNIIAITFM